VFEHKVASLNAQQLLADADTTKQLDLIRQISEAYAAQATKQEGDAEKLRTAELKDFQDRLQHEKTLLELRQQGTQENLSHAQALGTNTDVVRAERANTQTGVDSAALAYQQAFQRFLEAMSNPGQQSAEKLQELAQSVATTRQRFDDLNREAKLRGEGWGNAGRDALDRVFGRNNVQEAVTGVNSAGKPVDGMTRFADAIGAASDAVTTFGSALNAIENGMKQGGVLGGVGAGISAFSGAMQDIPVIGPEMGAIGSAISMIGSLFTKAAQDIADKITKGISDVMQRYQSQDSTMYQTIQALEQQRTQAIAQLSGKKGGQDELNKILPSLDQEIASLKLQQKQIGENFQESLTYLQAGSGPLSQWEQSWVGIMQQVRAYRDAVGDAASASNVQAFLTLQLAQQRKQLQDQLSQAESSAISDAINLNNLLKQRNDLEKSYAQQKFKIENADSLERRASGAVNTAVQLAQLRDSQGQALIDINAQITALQPKVAIESKVFDLATATADLQAQQNALNIAALQEQVNGWLQIQSILQATANLNPAGGSFGLGSFLGISGLGMLPGVDNSGQLITGDIHVNVTSPGGNGKTLGTDIGAAILAKLRGGKTGF
jgi:hypothetical protein